METLAKKKPALLCVLQILKERTDYNHKLTQDQIVEILSRDYEIYVERKTVGRNIATLKELGFEIETTRRGSYYNDRLFEESELRLLIDSVLASKHVAVKHSKDIVEKLCSLTSKHFKSHVKHVYSVNDWQKTENVTLFYNISVIDEAIDSGKQISFSYNRYGDDMKLHKTSLQKVSPYQMILHNQRYYLMGFNEKRNDIVYYRMERITDMKIISDVLTPLRSIKGYENGIDYKKFSTAMPYMFADDPVTIEFYVEGWALDQVIDWLGKEITLKKVDDKYYVRTTASKNAMEYWAMQYLNAVEIIKPLDLRERILNNVVNATEKYKNNK